jgi:hypothetical protein
MKITGTSRGRCHIYQMRSERGDDLNGILTRLTHRVWQTLDKRSGEPSLDPHLWPEIFHTLRHAFQNRLSHNPLCGHRDSCASMPCVLCDIQSGLFKRHEHREKEAGGFFNEKRESGEGSTGERFEEEKVPDSSSNAAAYWKTRVQSHSHPVPEKIYLLETRRPLPDFLKAISSAVARRLRLKGVRSERGETPLNVLLCESVGDALTHCFFMSEACRSCPARETLGDRRVWVRDVLESPWGGIRDILPEDVPMLEEVEEA